MPQTVLCMMEGTKQRKTQKPSMQSGRDIWLSVVDAGFDRGAPAPEGCINVLFGTVFAKTA